jgi:hypothetical protein
MVGKRHTLSLSASGCEKALRDAAAQNASLDSSQRTCGRKNSIPRFDQVLTAFNPVCFGYPNANITAVGRMVSFESMGCTETPVNFAGAVGKTIYRIPTVKTTRFETKKAYNVLSEPVLSSPSGLRNDNQADLRKV